MKRTFWIMVLLAGLVGGGYYGYQYYQQQKAAASATLRTGQISLGSAQSDISGVGTVRAKQTATIS